MVIHGNRDRGAFRIDAREMCTGLCAAIAIVMILCCPGSAASGRENERPITKPQIAALKLAIQDEIYDYDYEGRYVDISLLEARGYRLPLYIRPDIVGDAGGAIYKLPIGEVQRAFQFRQDGLAVLIRDPRDDFPPTSNSTLTLYLRDEQVCSAKAHWIHDVVWIDPHPPKARIQEAIQRERKRKGFSQHDYIRDSRKNP